MFKLIKKIAGREPEAAPAAKRSPSRPRRSARGPDEPLPLPEVVEGNDATDWDLWQDSVDAFDSRSQSLMPSARSSGYSDTLPSELDGLDPFSRVGKNRDL
jgi:hypothetical protein